MLVEPKNNIQLLDVAQIALTVPDLAQAKAFYQDVLELKFLFDAGTMAFFQCGPVRLMLGEAPGGAREAAASDGAGPASTIVYFRVADLEATARLLESRGASFVQQPHLVARMKSHDLWLSFLKDPAGNTLGLMSEVSRTTERENANDSR